MFSDIEYTKVEECIDYIKEAISSYEEQRIENKDTDTK